MRFNRPLVLALSCVLLGAVTASTPVWAAETPAKAAVPATATGQRLDALYERYFEELLQSSPVLATFIGDHRYDDRLPNSIGPDYRAAAKRMNDRYLAEVQAIDPSSLSPAERTSYEIFLRERLRARAAERFPDHLLPLNQAGSLLTLMPSLGSGSNAQPFATVQDYENWLQRLDGMVIWMDQAIVNMREGMAKGVVQPRPVMEKVLPQLDAMIVARARGQRVLCAGEEVPRRYRRGRSRAAHPRVHRRDSRRGGACVPAAARLRARRVPAEDSLDGGVECVAGRRGVVRVQRPGAHDDDDDRRGDPPTRPERGGAHPRRDGQGAAGGRLQGRPAGVLHAPRDGSAVLLHRRRRPAARLSRPQAAHRRCAAEAVLGVPEGRLRSAPGRSVPRAVGGGRVVPESVGRRLAARHLLRQHVQPEGAAEVRHGDAVAARGGAGPPLPGGPSSRNSRTCRVFAASAATTPRSSKAGRCMRNTSARSSGCSRTRTSGSGA